MTKFTTGILEESVRRALDELGTPTAAYPAPVANAIKLLQNGLAGKRNTTLLTVFVILVVVLLGLVATSKVF